MRRAGIAPAAPGLSDPGVAGGLEGAGGLASREERRVRPGARDPWMMGWEETEGLV